MFWSRRREQQIAVLEQQLAEARQEIEWLTDSRADVIAKLFEHA